MSFLQCSDEIIYGIYNAWEGISAIMYHTVYIDEECVVMGDDGAELGDDNSTF